jgi:hypothetical protein
MIAKPSAPKQNFNVTSGDLPLTPTTNALDRRSRLFVFLYQCRENLQADNAGTIAAHSAILIQLRSFEELEVLL